MRSASVTALALFSFAAFASPSDRDNACLGEWAVVRLESGSHSVRREDLDRLKIEFAENKVIVWLGEESQAASYKLSPASRPRQIDISPDQGPTKGRKYMGIYRPEGGELLILLDESGERRPSEFTDERGNRVTRIVLRRVK